MLNKQQTITCQFNKDLNPNSFSGLLEYTHFSHLILYELNRKI